VNNQEILILLKNAIANLARGSSAAIVALFLPAFLTRSMSVQAYSTWSLVLQVSAYLGYLDFGIQTAVGRFVAQANEKGDAEHRDRIVSTAFATLTMAGILAVACSALTAYFWADLFSHMPSGLVDQARIAFLLVASSLAVGLPFSVFNGVFIGLQRNEVPASIIAVSRIISALCMILVVRRGGDLVSMGLFVAAINLASYFLQYGMYRKLCGGHRLSPGLVSIATGRELFDYCLSLSIWSFGMLLVTGLDLTIVGVVQFEAVAYYAVATSMITFIVGAQNAIFSSIVSPVAVLNARGDSRGLANVMISATRYGTFLLLLTGMPLVLFPRLILGLWVGEAYGVSGARLLQVLAAANIIRLSTTPYAMTLVGTGQQRLVILSPIIEGVTNLVISVGAGLVYGAVGVAVGTLVGAVVGVILHLSYNMQRTTSFDFRISDYVLDGLLRPSICAVPLVGYAYLLRCSNLSAWANPYLILSAAVATTGFLIWRYGLLGPERDRLRFRRLLGKA
jgi:O-antigen/teichoic acid export membrane protein